MVGFGNALSGNSSKLFDGSSGHYNSSTFDRSGLRDQGNHQSPVEQFSSRSFPGQQTDPRSGRKYDPVTRESAAREFSHAQQRRQPENPDDRVEVENYDYPDAIETSTEVMSQIWIAQMKESEFYPINDLMPFTYSNSLTYEFTCYYYGDSFMARVPEEGVSHLATQFRKKLSGAMTRFGHSIKNERGFAQTGPGQKDLWYKLEQIRQASLQTATLNAFTAIIDQEDIFDEEMEVYDEPEYSPDADIYERTSQERMNFACMQKNPEHGTRDLIARAESAMNRRNGIGNRFIFPSGSASFVAESMRNDNLFIQTGLTLRDVDAYNPVTSNLNGNRYYESFPIRMGHHLRNWDPFYKDIIIGEYFTMFLDANRCEAEEYQSRYANTKVHDMRTDDWAEASYVDYFKYLGYWKGYASCNYRDDLNGHPYLSNLGIAMFTKQGIESYYDLYLVSGQLEYFKKCINSDKKKKELAGLKKLATIPYMPGYDLAKLQEKATKGTKRSEDDSIRRRAQNLGVAGRARAQKRKRQRSRSRSRTGVQTRRNDYNQGEEWEEPEEEGEEEEPEEPEEEPEDTGMDIDEYDEDSRNTRQDPRRGKGYTYMDDENDPGTDFDQQIMEIIRQGGGEIDHEYDILAEQVYTYEDTFPDSELDKKLLEVYQHNSDSLVGDAPWIGWIGIGPAMLDYNLRQCLADCSNGNGGIVLFPFEQFAKDSNHGRLTSDHGEMLTKLDEKHQSSYQWIPSGNVNAPGHPELYLNPYMIDPTSLDFSAICFTISHSRLALYRLTQQGREISTPIFAAPNVSTAVVKRNMQRIGTFMYSFALSSAYSFVDDYLVKVDARELEDNPTDIISTLKRVIIPLNLPGHATSREYLKIVDKVSKSYSILESQRFLQNVLAEVQELVRLLYVGDAGDGAGDSEIAASIERIRIEKAMLLDEPFGTNSSEEVGSKMRHIKKKSTKTSTGAVAKYQDARLGYQNHLSQVLSDRDPDKRLFEMEDIHAAQIATVKLERECNEKYGTAFEDTESSFPIYRNHYFRLYLFMVTAKTSTLASWTRMVQTVDILYRQPAERFTLPSGHLVPKTVVLSAYLQSRPNQTPVIGFDPKLSLDEFITVVKTDPKYIENLLDNNPWLTQVLTTSAGVNPNVNVIIPPSLAAAGLGPESEADGIGSVPLWQELHLTSQRQLEVVFDERSNREEGEDGPYIHSSDLLAELTGAQLVLMTTDNDVFYTSAELIIARVRNVFQGLGVTESEITTRLDASASKVAVTLAGDGELKDRIRNAFWAAEEAYLADGDAGPDSGPGPGPGSSPGSGNKAAPDPADQVVDDILKAAYIGDGRYSKYFAENNLPTGIGLVCFRPNIGYKAGVFVYMAGNGETGKTFYKAVDMLMNEDAVTHVQRGSLIQYMTAVLTCTRNRVRIANVFLKGYLGGGNMAVWDFDDDEDMEDYEKGNIMAKDIIVTGRFMNDKKVQTVPCLNWVGTWEDGMNANSDEIESSAYPTSNEIKRLLKITQDSDCCTSDGLQVTKRFNTGPNTLCYRAFQWVYSSSKGSHSNGDVLSLPVGGHGHFSRNIGPGSGAWRRGDSTHIPRFNHFGSELILHT